MEMRELLAMLLVDPLRAAEKMDRLADALKEKAAEIRQQHENPYKAPGGMTDRVKACVIGPDGEVKQSIETN